MSGKTQSECWLAAQWAQPDPARITIWLLCLMPLLCFIGCLGPGKKDKTCVATLTSSGKTFTGEAETESEAQRNDCNKYCRDADPEYEARYHIWLDSPKGKAVGRPSREKAIFEDK